MLGRGGADQQVNGLQPAALTELLAALAPGAAGAQVTVFDPGLDPDGRYAALLTGILVAGLRHLGRGRVGFRVDI